MERAVSDDVAPDGSPVPVYLAMPPHDAFELVADQVPPGGSVLDLGCGVGRLANALAAAGVTVTGVDVHPRMLAHLSPTVEAVQADIVDLDLVRTFDVVVLASHLVNHPTAARAYLATCRHHVDEDGAVLVERFHPALLDDAAITRLLDAAGLAFVDWLDDDGRWLLAEPRR